MTLRGPHLGCPFSPPSAGLGRSRGLTRARRGSSAEPAPARDRLFDRSPEWHLYLRNPKGRRGHAQLSTPVTLREGGEVSLQTYSDGGSWPSKGCGRTLPSGRRGTGRGGDSQSQGRTAGNAGPKGLEPWLQTEPHQKALYRDFGQGCPLPNEGHVWLSFTGLLPVLKPSLGNRHFPFW